MFQERILIIEDEVLIAEDLASILKEMGYEITAVAYSVEDAREAFAKMIPDLVLMDINLEGRVDGIELAHEFGLSDRGIPLIYISSYADAMTVRRASRTGPKGYIVKPFEEKDIFCAVEIALYNAAKERSKGSRSQQEARLKSLLELLTSRENEVLQCIRQGKSNKLMADEQFVSVNTIKTHIKNIYEKLDVHSRTELMALLHGENQA